MIGIRTAILPRPTQNSVDTAPPIAVTPVPTPPPPAPPAPTAHALETFLPSREPREGTALCLSGGGFRAALFHLGALRRLNELGVLSQVTTITSVSGGSIIAAHLADRIRAWPAPGQRVTDWDATVAAPFKELTSRDARTGPVLKRLLPWNWFRSSTAVKALAALYEQRVTRLRLAELPERPRYVFCATDISYAVNWEFSQDRVGDYQVGYMSPPPDWPVARAVAASSCFPPVFDPLPVALKPDLLTGGHAKKGPERDQIVRAMGLSDGGVYDNLGLEPVWKHHATLLVSDGGSPFAASKDAGFFWRLQEYFTVAMEQVRSLRKRWLVSSFVSGDLAGAYWGVGSAASHYDLPQGYSEGLASNVIARIRTDLNAFTAAEQAVLENHGYALADAAIQRHAAQLIAPGSPPYQPPNPDWLDEARVRDALSRSHRQRLFG